MTSAAGTPPSEREVEFKLRSTGPLSPADLDAALAGLDGSRDGALATGARPAGTAVAAAVGDTHLDLYLDDERGSLRQQGIGLRLRRDRSGAALCCKDRGRRRGALYERTELEAPWPGDGVPGCAQDLPERLRDAVEPYLLERPLRTIVMLEVERERRVLMRGDRTLGEVCFDRAVASSPSRQHSFCEIEVEVAADLPACAAVVTQLRAALPVVPAPDDKLAHSLRALGLAPGTPPPPSPPSPPRRCGELLAARLQAQVRRLQAAEVAVRLAGTAEDIHEMRVVLRRLRVLVRAFRGAWPTGDAARADLALTSLARELGGLRERDVLCQRLPLVLKDLPAELRPYRTGLVDLLQSTRDSSLARARTTLRSPAHRDDLARLFAMAQPGSMRPDFATRRATFAARRLRKAARSVRRAVRRLGAGTSLVELHDLRLRLKRLRMLAEELEAVHRPLRGRCRRRLLAALVQLGAMCDHDAAAQHYLALLEAAPADRLSPHLAGLVGACASEHRRVLPQARARALRAAERLDRRWFWRRFRPAVD